MDNNNGPLKPAIRRSTGSTAAPQYQQSNFFVEMDDGSELSFADEVDTCSGVANEKAKEEILGYEDKLVQYSKALIITLMGFLAVSFGLITFNYIRSKERSQLERHVSLVQLVC